MGLNTFYHVDTRYFHLSGKCEWFIHYLLLVMNDFVFFNPLKCQFCTICDIFLAFIMENDNEISFKWVKFFLSNRYKVFFTYPTSLNDYFTTFCILYLIIWFWTPFESRFWPCSFRPTLKKIGPMENFNFFVFYHTTYSTLRKCRNWTCIFFINIYLLPGGRWTVVTWSFV